MRLRARRFDPLVVRAQDGGAALFGEAWAKVPGAGDLASSARARRDQRFVVRAHAQQDSTPVFLSSAGAGEFSDRESFRDGSALFGPMAKWVAQIDRPERCRVREPLPFTWAMWAAGPGGARAAPRHAHARASPTSPPYQVVQAEALGRRHGQLGACSAGEAPLVVLGGTVWTAKPAADLRAFAESGLPGRCRFASRISSTTARHYVGESDRAHPSSPERVRMRRLLVIGCAPRRDDDRATRHRAAAAERARHVHAGAEEWGGSRASVITQGAADRGCVRGLRWTARVGGLARAARVDI